MNADKDPGSPESYLVPICSQSHSPEATTVLISKTHRSLLPALDLINGVSVYYSHLASFIQYI